MRHKWALLSALLLGFLWSAAQAQGRILEGTVTDSAGGGPVANASATVEGTRIMGFSNENGKFRITGVPEGELTLVVRAIGYRRREIPVSADQTSVEFALPRDAFKLDEVVVTGLATGVERRNLGNAVATVSSDDIGFAPTPSLEQQLQGKVAGADIQANSGAPGGGLQVRLRGITSINATAEPLWVVDGVIVSDVAIPSNQNAVTAAASGSNPSLNQDAQVNRIADLNPNDIANIEILRGASASAIYGAKASNGVVIITTKRGRVGAPQVTLGQRFGFYQLSNKLGSRTFTSPAEVDAAFGAGKGSLFTGQAFDLEDQLAGRKELSFETSANLSGGTEDTKYFASGTVGKEAGIIENTGFKRQAVRLNLDQRFGSGVSASLSTNLLHTLAQRGLTNNDNSGTSYYVVFASTPSFVDLTRQPGDTFAHNTFVPSNPLQTAALSKNDENVWRFLGSSKLQWDVFQRPSGSLRFIASGGLDFFHQKNTLFFPPELQFEPLDGQPGTSLLSNSDNLSLNLTGNAVHTYAPPGNSFSATTSAGVQFARRTLDIARITSRNLIAGQQDVNAGTDVQVNELRSQIKDLGFFAQEEFLTLKERLLLTAGARLDQSSLNANPKKLSFYPKFSGSYRFVKPARFLDELKVRLAYGESGNEALYGQKFTALKPGNLGGVGGTVVGDTTGSKDLRPERQREIEGGFDANLWNSRANLEVTVFQKMISDLLLARTLAPSSGFVAEVLNGGRLRTRGVEVALGLVPLQNNAIDWLFRYTFSLNRSVVRALPVPAFRAAGFGASLGQFRIEEGASPTQMVGNDTLTAADVAADPTLGAIGDVVVRRLADANPDFRMSFINDISWKNFSLHGVVDWQQGGAILNLTRLLYDFGQVTEDFADPIPGSTQTVGQRRLAGFGKTAGTYIEDASFVKLRELTLTYDLPQGAVRNLFRGTRYVRVSLSARNLLTSSPYTGLDPEVSNFGNQAIGRNIDVAPFPPSRSFWVGIDLGF
jgi:TonB-linked SusC/RagA family outer membrane protein